MQPIRSVPSVVVDRRVQFLLRTTLRRPFSTRHPWTEAEGLRERDIVELGAAAAATAATGQNVRLWVTNRMRVQPTSDPDSVVVTALVELEVPGAGFWTLASGFPARVSAETVAAVLPVADEPAAEKPVVEAGAPAAPPPAAAEPAVRILFRRRLPGHGGAHLWTEAVRWETRIACHGSVEEGDLLLNGWEPIGCAS